jgi:hypothetical protein
MRERQFAELLRVLRQHFFAQFNAMPIMSLRMVRLRKG